MMYDFYKILGVERTATVQEIKLAYRRKAKQYHPDVNSSASAHDFFTVLNTANDTLCDAVKRRKYDLKLEYKDFHAAHNAPAPEPAPHRDYAYRRNQSKGPVQPKQEEKDFEPSTPLFKFFLFSIMFIGMLCIFIPSLAVYHNVINFGVLLLLFPGFFMIRDVIKTIFISE